MQLWFDGIGCENSSYLQTVNGDKGRIEIRGYLVCDKIDWLKERHHSWFDPNSTGCVTFRREVNRKTLLQTRYFTSLFSADAAVFADAVRSHWGIENRLRWVLDVVFRDDDCRVQKYQAPKNFTVIKHMAINLLDRAKQKKSLRLMREKVGWNNQFLKAILTA